MLKKRDAEAKAFVELSIFTVLECDESSSTANGVI